MSIKSGWTEVKDSLLKAIGGKSKKKNDDPGKCAGAVEKSDGEEKDPDDDDDDDDDDDEDDSLDATEIVKSMSERIEELAEGQRELRDMLDQVATLNKAIGRGMVEIATSQEAMAKTSNPRRGLGPLEAAAAGIIGKGGLAGEKPRLHRQFTERDRDEIRPIIVKAVEKGELDTIRAGRIETEINKSILSPGYQISDANCLAFLRDNITAK